MTSEEKKIARQIAVKKYNDKMKEKHKQYYIDNKEKIKLKQDERREQINEYNKDYYSNNVESQKQRVKKYREENPDKIKQYRELNKDKRKAWETNKRNTDPMFKFKHNLRCLIRQSFKNNGFKKTSKTFEILGCSFDEFKIYLESKFEPWMNWENKGLYNGELNHGWDLDHIIPSSSATTEENLIKLNHYTNLQPLCSKINRDIKKAK
jgi:hypothetical protein